MNSINLICIIKPQTHVKMTSRVVALQNKVQLIMRRVFQRWILNLPAVVSRRHQSPIDLPSSELTKQVYPPKHQTVGLRRDQNQTVKSVAKSTCVKRLSVVRSSPIKITGLGLLCWQVKFLIQQLNRRASFHWKAVKFIMWIRPTCVCFCCPGS